MKCKMGKITTKILDDLEVKKGSTFEFNGTGNLKQRTT